MKSVYIEDDMCTVYKLILHKVQRVLNDLGYANADCPEKADLCLVGLCASFEADEDRSVEILKRVYEAGTPVYAYGCMVTVNPGRILSAPMFPSWDIGGLLRAITGDQNLGWDWRDIPTTFRTDADYRVNDPTKKFIAISTGCNFRCSYCPHRIGTGPLVSVPEDEVLDQIHRLNDGETKVIVLTGTDTACYGQDRGTSFAPLLDAILRIINPGVNLHVAQFNPEGLFRDAAYTDDLFALFSHPQVKDIQLPIQTTSPRLLALMNRHYSPDALADFLTRLRLNRGDGDPFLRTDLMVGFPTETMTEFIDTIWYAIRQFSEVALYAFEMKPGTPVHTMGLTPVDPEEIGARKRYARVVTKNLGLLVHSGGQESNSLLENDKIKALRRQGDAE